MQNNLTSHNLFIDTYKNQTKQNKTYKKEARITKTIIAKNNNYHNMYNLNDGQEIHSLSICYKK